MSDMTENSSENQENAEQTNAPTPQQGGSRGDRRLSNFLLNPRFQLLFLGYLGTLTLFLILYYYYMTTYRFESLIQSIPVQNVVLIETVEAYLKTTQSDFITFAVVYFLFYMAGGIVLTHKIAGPLYKLRMHMKKCADEGTLSHVHFRKHDFFIEISDEFNALTDKLKD